MEPRLELTAYNHVGIRVAERQRSLAFYEVLGFREVWWSEELGVSILRNPADLEINLIVNANHDNGGVNVLIDDGEVRYPGYTHASFQVSSIEQTVAALKRADIAITEGPVRLGEQEIAVFVRDPDRNVVELAQILSRVHSDAPSPP